MIVPNVTINSCEKEPASGLDEAFADCAALVKTLDPDRYFSCLFAPKASQPFLFALYAFNAEIARVRETVSEPMPGEIRHQWWREALSCNNQEAAIENPIAAALLHTLKRFRLPPAPLLALIEARSFDLYDDPMPTWRDLEGYCGETSSALIRLASLILADGRDVGSADLCGYAGVSYAMTGLLRAFPIHARRHQCYLPQEVLITCGVSLDDLWTDGDANADRSMGRENDGLRAVLATVRARARAHLGDLQQRIGELEPCIRPAFYPICLVRPYLERMERPDYHPFETLVDIPALQKFWCLGKMVWQTR